MKRGEEKRRIRHKGRLHTHTHTHPIVVANKCEAPKTIHKLGKRMSWVHRGHPDSCSCSQLQLTRAVGFNWSRPQPSRNLSVGPRCTVVEQADKAPFPIFCRHVQNRKEKKKRTLLCHSHGTFANEWVVPLPDPCASDCPAACSCGSSDDGLHR